MPGAGDRVAESLEVMGYAVTRLTGADLTPDRLSGLDAVVIGVRAFNIRDDLAVRLPALCLRPGRRQRRGAIPEARRPEDAGIRTEPIATLSGTRDRRKRDGHVPCSRSPTLTTPNKITAADFEGWVQERGIYYPDQWDDHLAPILACNDPGEAPLFGRAVDRQPRPRALRLHQPRVLPAAPRGGARAYRLFANLISLGNR